MVRKFLECDGNIPLVIRGKGTRGEWSILLENSETQEWGTGKGLGTCDGQQLTLPFPL
jgi:hypothetical protein